MEDEFGRTRPAEWAPRTLDIDILLYGDAVIAEGDLQVPHPRLHERAFVLAPLSELAPDLRHPVLHREIRALVAALPPGSVPAPLRATW